MTDEPITHTEVTRTRVVNTGRTAYNERYEYAPVTYPQIGQNTFICKEDGNLVSDLEVHDAFHAKLDTVLVSYATTQSAPLVEPEKITEPAPIRAAKARVKEAE